MDFKLYILLVIAFGVINTVKADSDLKKPDDKFQAEYKVVFNRLYPKSGDALPPNEVLKLLRKMRVLLKRLPERKEAELDTTRKLIRLGELDYSMCYEHHFDWFKILALPGGAEPQVNIAPYVAHYTKDLKEVCARGNSNARPDDETCKFEAEYDAISKRIYAKSGEQLEQEKVLELFKKAYLPLKKLPGLTDEKDFTLKMIRLGELDERMCKDAKFSWFKEMTKHWAEIGSNYVSLVPYIKHYSTELRRACDFYLSPGNDGDQPLAPEVTLKLLRKLARKLTILPKNEERIRVAESTDKMIKLAELDESFCDAQTFYANFKVLIEQQASMEEPNINIKLFVEHYSERLKRHCDRHCRNDPSYDTYSRNSDSDSNGKSNKDSPSSGLSSLDGAGS